MWSFAVSVFNVPGQSCNMAMVSALFIQDRVLWLGPSPSKPVLALFRSCTTWKAAGLLSTSWRSRLFCSISSASNSSLDTRLSSPSPPLGCGHPSYIPKLRCSNSLRKVASCVGSSHRSHPCNCYRMSQGFQDFMHLNLKLRCLAWISLAGPWVWSPVMHSETMLLQFTQKRCSPSWRLVPWGRSTKLTYVTVPECPRVSSTHPWNSNPRISIFTGSL